MLFVIFMQMDPAKKHQSIRTIAACYFTLLSIMATSLIQLLLFVFGMGDLIPLLMSYVLALPIAWLSGLLFANKIVYAQTKLKCFLYGVLLILFTLPLYDFFLLFLLQSVHPSMYNLGHGLQDSALLFLLIIIYSFVLIGSWLIVFGGFAALFLKTSFAPNVLKFSQKLDDVYKMKEQEKP